MRDVAAVRAERAERAHAVRTELARARQLLETEGPVRLSFIFKERCGPVIRGR
ncbi:hypothetical protein ACFV19_16485 [Streptomyces griseoluteus]|uniref:hypothetical protein n=1 Tax=Streptomyces griseoluteus TaxID=29306 RepID=UPI003687505E